MNNFARKFCKALFSHSHWVYMQKDTSKMQVSLFEKVYYKNNCDQVDDLI